jgi:hypothetical protein
MAVELKLEYSVNPEITQITVKEVTGQYTVNNTGGWGSPNINKNSIALVLYATYQPYDKDLINLSTLENANVYYFSSNAVNNEDTYFNIPYFKDGWYEFNVAIVNTTSNLPIENTIIFNTALNKLQIYKNNVYVDLQDSDWELLKDSDLFNSSTLKEILLLNLIKQRNCQLEKYIECMKCTSCKCDTLKEEYIKINSIIQATDYRFHSDKPFEAQRMVEILTKQFKCCK